MRSRPPGRLPVSPPLGLCVYEPAAQATAAQAADGSRHGRRRGARALLRGPPTADAPAVAATTAAALGALPAGFFLSSELAVLGVSRRDLARCCRATGPLPLRRAVPAAVLEPPAAPGSSGWCRALSCPARRCFRSCGRGAPLGEACSAELLPAATPRIQFRPEPRGKQDFLCAAFEAVNSHAWQC